MTYVINGQTFRELIEYGAKNLARNRDEINALNVFPVPDGDTGTNMVLTLQNGVQAMKSTELSQNAKSFSQAIVYGARGNSGVILSQFFKGFAECFATLDEAGAFAFAMALKRGVKCAYGAVSNPAEGTILTVLREASEHACKRIAKGKYETIDEIVAGLLKKAKSSLEKTPDLLPILKSAGVVDSGGAGAVYIFEGMYKYLCGEEIEGADMSNQSQAPSIDYTAYNEESVFEYGYCTELLLQLLSSKKRFNYDSFLDKLSKLGDSIVTSHNESKVKIHIHTTEPEEVFALGHKYGEFLTIKVENMSVQHNEIYGTNAQEKPQQSASISVYTDVAKGSFSVLCVAHEASMKDYFIDMGADIVLLCDRLCPPSASDFIELFKKAETKTVFVFANSKNTYLSADQASKLYDEARVIVVNTKSDSECYACLPMIDYEEDDHDAVLEGINEVISNIQTVTVSVASKESTFDEQKIEVGELFAFTGSKLLSVGNSYVDVTCEAIEKIMQDEPKDVISLFISPKIKEDTVEKISSFVSEKYMYTELSVVETKDDFFDIVLSFE